MAREKEREGAQQMQQKVTGKGLLSKGWFVKHVRHGLRKQTLFLYCSSPTRWQPRAPPIISAATMHSRFKFQAIICFMVTLRCR